MQFINLCTKLIKHIYFQRLTTNGRHSDVIVTSSRRQFAKGLSKTFDNSIVAMVTDL